MSQARDEKVKGVAQAEREEGRLTKEEQLIRAFRHPIPRVKTSLLYRLGLLLVTIVMVALPIAYVALIIVVGALVYYHATTNVGILEGSGSARGRFAAYAAPIVAGCTIILFMLKPLFAPRAKRVMGHTLSPNQHPYLFLLISRVCQAVGSPFPQTVEVDLQVNASASFRRGFRSFFGDDLALTIGLPLVQGLSIQNFAGVLAHEFGHFSQGAGMRLTYVIRSINNWFALVVYGRDSWDAKLIAASQESRGFIAISLLLARVAVWLSRRILWCLMMIGHGVSCFMLRQMEYDADCYEVRLAGAPCFADTMRKLYLLDAASYLSDKMVVQHWQEKRERMEDIPAAIVSLAKQLPDDLRKHIDHSLKEESTEWFATHPASKDRVARANAENPAPAFQLEGPATHLFSNFEKLAQEVTREQYQMWGVNG